MATTTPKGIVVPVVGDVLTPLQTVFAAMGSSIDTVLNGYITTGSYATSTEVSDGTATAKVTSPKALRDAGIYAGDTGWVDISSSVSAATGWTKGSGFAARARRIGKTVQIYVTNIQKAGSSPLSVGVSGNVTNTTILTGVPSQFRPDNTAPLSPGGTGRIISYYASTDGTISIAAVQPNVNWTSTKNFPTGENVSCGGQYFGA